MRVKRRNKSYWTWLAAFALAGTLLRAQTNTPEPKPASLSGIVTNSLTGEPLAHAHVRLDLFTQQKGSRYGAMTTADGRFSIKAIAPGHYQMTADRRGYQPVSGQDTTNQNIELKAGEEVTDLVIRLTPDAVISGRVVNEKGLPMDGIEVEAVAGHRQSVVTNDRGEFRIGALREGRYLVKAQAMQAPLPQEIRTDGTTAVNYGPTYYPSSPEAKSAVPVSTQAGQESSGIEIKLVPGPVLHLSGTVSGVRGADNIGIKLDSGDRQRGYRVEPDMHFTIWRVPPGHYQLFAEGYDNAAGGQIRSAPVELNLTTTSIDGLRLDLMRPFELAGRAQIEAGAAITAHEGTLPSLWLQPLGTIQNGDQDQEIDREGRFKITDVFPGRYHVLVTDTPDNFYVKSITLGGTEFADGILDLRHGSSGRPLTVVLGKDGAQISGVVRDAKGPAGSARVALFFDDEFGFDLVDSATTQADGGYVLHGIAPGRYRILAYSLRNAGGAWSSDSLALYESVTEKIDVSAGDKVTQDLKLLP
jgi:hypothetical protein